jgi:hypothetical protein
MTTIRCPECGTEPGLSNWGRAKRSPRCTSDSPNVVRSSAWLGMDEARHSSKLGIGPRCCSALGDQLRMRLRLTGGSHHATGNSCHRRAGRRLPAPSQRQSGARLRHSPARLLGRSDPVRRRSLAALTILPSRDGRAERGRGRYPRVAVHPLPALWAGRGSLVSGPAPVPRLGVVGGGLE